MVIYNCSHCMRKVGRYYHWWLFLHVYRPWLF
uniref:Uncharacterized protein n=1 Tax=Rhizophora mucronata TaxID=61149 RepID=A0A2P2P9E0_RHIMU